MELIANNTQYRSENIGIIDVENDISRGLFSQSQININDRDFMGGSFTKNLDLANRKIVEILIKPLLENYISETSSDKSYNILTDFVTDQMIKLFASDISKEIFNKNLTKKK